MSALSAVIAQFQDFNALQKVQGLMSWDQQLLMPAGGVEARSAHLARLGRMAHEILVSDEMARLVENAAGEAEPGSDDAATVRAVQREIDVRKALPSELVERKSKVSSDAYLAWRKARAESDFSLLAPYLEQLFDIARETSERRGFGQHVYDPLIDLFEEGATYAQARNVFDALKGPIREIIDAVHERGPVDSQFLYGDWDAETLRAWAVQTATKVGFDFTRGRLDVTSNAFCSNFSRGDVRMTTRHNDRVEGVIFSSLHEMGHGLYEQGSPAEWDRSPLAGGTSMAVHESQSRLWENIVGRSLPFWKHFFPALRNALNAKLDANDANTFYKAINRVEPGPIRIGSDELSYNLHILVRFEMECEILERKIAINDIPEAWNSKYAEYLGVNPQNDGEGCLQDVHWSRGSVGYFPTYTMGNLISWQVWETLRGDLGDTDALMERGDFAPILGWLQEKIYTQGKRFKPNDLVHRVTGKLMNPDAYIAGMRTKYLGRTS